MATILERIKKITADKLNVEANKITAASGFVKDLGADSLDLVELIMGLEDEFSTPENKVKIPDTEAAKIQTVQDAVDYIKLQGVA